MRYASRRISAYLRRNGLHIPAPAFTKEQLKRLNKAVFGLTTKKQARLIAGAAKIVSSYVRSRIKHG